MWYEWLIFAIFFLLIPIAVANLKLISEKRANPTEEQKKNANLFCGFLMFFYWLCDLFYMAFILDSLALKFVFGGLIMLIIFYNLSKAFISGASHFKWGLIQDFVVGVGMSIYLIYIIPCDDLKDVVIPIVSAVYGGLITLVGVAWTIKKADNDKKEDSIKNATPYLQVNNYKRNEVACNKVVIVEETDGKSYYPILLNNIGAELCIVKYVKSNGIYIPVENAHLAPADTIRFDFHLKATTLESIIVSDRLSNYYKFEFQNYDERFYYIGLPQKFDIKSIGEVK